jgi:hypothetical protein
MDLIRWLAELLATLERYNMAIWPMQALGYLLALVALFFAIRPTRYSSAIIGAILSFLWLRTGIVRCTAYADSPVNPCSVMGVIQGVLFAASVARSRLSFRFRWDVYSVVGLLFIAYATIGYFVVSYYAHWIRLPPRFGVDPGPIIVFTFGLLLLSDKAMPKLLLVVPALWILAAFLSRYLGNPEDTSLIMAGLLGTAMILFRDVVDAGTADLE